MYHLSARLAWHMDGWNGRICRNPADNTYCVGPYSFPGQMIAESRDLEWEQANRGRSCVKLDRIPPCIYSINAFGTEKLEAYADPPDFFNDNTTQLRWPLPPATICTLVVGHLLHLGPEVAMAASSGYNMHLALRRNVFKRRSKGRWGLRQ